MSGISGPAKNKNAKRILIMDHNHNYSEWFESILSNQMPDAEIVSVSKDSDFKLVWDAEDFDMLLLSVYFPEAPALQLCREIRRTPKGREIKIVVFSEVFKEEQFHEADFAGADLLLSKNQSPGVWCKMIEVLLDCHFAKPKGRVLIADDEDHILKMLKNRLESINFDVVTATCGAEALRKSFDARPDVILLDIMMPELDGIKVYENLRQSPHTKYTPVIFLTGSSRKDFRQTSFKLGAYAYLTKPFESRMLCEIIERAYNGKDLPSPN